MKETDWQFLQGVKLYVENNPHIVAQLNNAIQSGINEALNAACAQAADMEATAAMALNARLFKGNQNFIADKLEKWKGKTALRWDDQIKALRKERK